MDQDSIHFSSPEDHCTPSHHAHHHTSQPLPPHAYRTAALASHPSLDLPIAAHGPLFQRHLQHMNAISTLPVVHPDFARDPPPPPPPPLPPPSTTTTTTITTPSTNLHVHSSSISHSTSDLHQPPPRPHHTSPNTLPPRPAPSGQHQFGILTPSIPLSQPSGIPRVNLEEDVFPSLALPPVTGPESPEHRSHGQLVNRIVIDPPNLQSWREKLFHVDETITLTNEEFETYFPHVDNIYSHRSTQKYKRKNFISHYWDCRMKGRPPGTPKSDDPAKRKRKRFARERDLCDVKIKITEHFPGATFSADGAINHAPTAAGLPPQQQFPDGITRPLNGQSMTAKKYWTIQRVNGNGGNGKADGIPGPHKHTLEKSDEIKKSTVQRFLAAQEKEAKKGQRQMQPKKPSGNALVTAKKHSKEDQFKLYAASFCPFSQRVWIALEAKSMPYQYCETDPFERPTHLLEANPRGLVPAIRQGDWASGESTVILEYLEDHDGGVPLLPTDPRLKANCRLWIDHINAKIVPAYFALVRALDVLKQKECIERLQSDILALVQAADERGPYFLGGDLCLVDIHFAPFVVRMSRILREFRNWCDPMPGTRWQRWSDALVQNPHVQATTSLDELYVETMDIFVKSRPPFGE